MKFMSSLKTTFKIQAEVKKDDWLGYKNLSVGNLIIFYSKIKIMKEIVEVLEITNTEMVDYMSGEEVIDVLG